ncbi:ATP-binding protein [Noviherbaspirillum sp. CPCC 100848]|uniref:histidine kinase n=1 Tax=Noviherbaspirillum album TaxID=3080276 RepID=A0ABU6J3N8_9BURK|nr:ATP-binding protein [Noviherbaspirillum sp. CPCC 100848]MEC4718232.1 ATP-binding protein [Noviherbaspirillum sp. CPCC 100848]
MNVRSHLGLLVLAVLLPVVLFSAVVLNFLIAAEREAVLRGMQEAARATVLVMDREMAAAMAVAQSLGTSRTLAKGDFEDFYQQAKTANAGSMVNLALIDESGHQLLNTAAPFGAVIPPPTDITKERVRNVFANKKPSYTSLLKGRATKKYVVAAEFPVQINDGRRFLINQWMFSSHLNDLIPSQNIPKTWVISVFDREGITIARNARTDEYVGNPPMEKQRDMIVSGFEGISQGYIRDGIKVYGAWTRSPVTGWTVGVGVPAAEIQYAAVRSVALTAVGFIVAILFAVTGAILFSRRLVGAIEKASRSAGLLGQRQVPPIEDLRVAEMNQLQMALHKAGNLLLQSETARVRHLEEAEQARAVAEKAQAVAEEQNKAKDDFLAMLGHELRNPLAAISSGVTLLNMPNVDAERSMKAKGIIARQTNHLSHLVDELLDAHRILSGKITLTKTAIDLQAAVQSCLSAFEARGATSAHHMRVELSPAIIEADATRLEQMISNLIENALKYTQEGGSIKVSVKAQEGLAIFAVEDTGVGIPPELLSRAVEVFVQGKVINRSKGGLGIGLAVVNSLAKQHGATLVAESPGINQGSVFSIRFPLAEQSSVHPDAPKSVQRSKAGKIIVIEDNRDVREMMCAMLGEYGFEIISAENGQSGIENAYANLPDVALVDIDLPDMSGYEVASQLRKDLRTAKMRLVAITGYGQPSDREKALTSGFDLHLKKPVVIEDLIAALNTTVNPG